MPSRTVITASHFGLLFLVVNTTAIHAQEPELRAVSTYTGDMAAGDISAARYIGRRCAALFAIVGPQLAERGASAAAEV